MAINFNSTSSDTPNDPRSEVVAEYRFIITFETYPDENIPPDGFEREVMSQIERALSRDFANEVEFLFGGMVQVKIGPLEQGSILGSVLLVLASTITVADFFSKYKDFYESLVLLRNQLRAILSRVLNRGVPRQVYRTVNITFVPGPATRAVPVVQRVSEPTGISRWLSPAFLIYLLVTNLFLTIIVFALVYRAVAAMYFGAP